MSDSTLLPSCSFEEFCRAAPSSVDSTIIDSVNEIVQAVKANGSQALRTYAERFGDIAPGGKLIFNKNDLEKAFFEISTQERDLITRTAERIAHFAKAQRDCLTSLSLSIPGGTLGHTFAPVDRVGCYAPGGRYPLPSSILMTAVTAKTAGVREIVAASPKPSSLTLAAAYQAGVEMLLAAGGAHAIAAFAYGIEDFSAASYIVGPGNRWVTAAKWLVSKDVGIDMLAGPSELLIVADGSVSPGHVADDLIAQAEHDVDAFPALISLDSELLQKVRNHLTEKLRDLPTRSTAEIALKKGRSIVVNNIEQAASLADSLAPEHLHLALANAGEVSSRFNHYGAIFVGQNSSEVLCDYGAGPNHVLPTGGAAKTTGGLSVFTFLRIRTFLDISDPKLIAGLATDAAAMARAEGLEGHARAAEGIAKQGQH